MGAAAFKNNFFGFILERYFRAGLHPIAQGGASVTKALQRRRRVLGPVFIREQGWREAACFLVDKRPGCLVIPDLDNGKGIVLRVPARGRS